MRTVLRVLAAAAIAAAAGDASATNGMRMIGFGPVQDAMGGANAAAGLDAASVLTNPATLSNLSGRIDFGASYFKPSVEYKATQPGGLPPGMVVGTSGFVTSDRGGSPIPAFGLVVPITDSLRFGLGAYGVGGMGVDFQQNLYGGTTFSSYSQMRFTPGVSYRVNELLAIGATANLAFATMEYQAASGFGQASHDSSSSFGGGATFGVLVTPAEWIRIGAAYETTSWFRSFEFNVPAQPALGLPAGHDRISFNQPQSATLGFAVTPVRPLLVAVDVQWIRWSETNGTNQPTFTASDGALPWNLNWEDQIVYKVGAQYTLPRKVMLRAGYNYGKKPLDSSRAFENIAFPAIAEHHLTAGIGHEITHRASINAAFGWSPRATLRGSNPNMPQNGGQAIQSYEARMSQVSFDMGFAYLF
jgi:long-chain fatty acid transport protein